MSDQIPANIICAEIIRTGIERRKQKAQSSLAQAPGSALPCPFCGSQTKYVDGGYPLQKGEWQPWWLVQCTADDCGIWASGKTKEAALEKWNRRTTPNTKVSDSRE